MEVKKEIEVCVECDKITDFKNVRGDIVCRDCLDRKYIKCNCGEYVVKQYYYTSTGDCYYCAEGDRGYL